MCCYLHDTHWSLFLYIAEANILFIFRNIMICTKALRKVKTSTMQAESALTNPTMLQENLRIPKNIFARSSFQSMNVKPFNVNGWLYCNKVCTLNIYVLKIASVPLFALKYLNPSLHPRKEIRKYNHLLSVTKVSTYSWLCNSFLSYRLSGQVRLKRPHEILLLQGIVVCSGFFAEVIMLKMVSMTGLSFLKNSFIYNMKCHMNYFFISVPEKF